MFCQKCGKEINDDAAVCIHCGCSTGGVNASKNGNVAFCKKCGKEINSDAVVCVHCGCAVEQSKIEKATESEHTTLLKIVSFLIPVIGIILYFVKSDDSNRKEYLKFALISIVISMVCGFFIGFVGGFMMI